MPDIYLVTSEKFISSEWTLEIDGETIICRLLEKENNENFFEWSEWTNGGWELSDTDSGLMSIVYEAWCAGELDFEY
tara:strand:+ start:3974 stop:4204 length:231 start_codon:yes stop_codon:yes gene_type:complete